MRIIGIGACNLDHLFVAKDFPAHDGVWEASASKTCGGGPVSTALANAARLGADCALIDRVGDDWRGDLMLGELEEAGVDTRWIEKAKGGVTSHASVVVREADGGRAICFKKGDLNELDGTELPANALTDCGVLHLNGRHFGTALRAAQEACVHGIPVSFDGGAGRYRDELKPLLALTTIAIHARAFGKALTGHDEPEAICASLLEAGAEIAAVTDGARGSWFATADGSNFHQPAFTPPAKIVDTTGCGDVFHGAFLHGLIEGFPIKDCARRAAALAAANCTALGARHLIDPEAAITQVLNSAP